MQVSWIDPEEVRSLLAKLDAPRPTPNASAWEVHTLPVVPPASTDAVHLLSEPSTLPTQAPEPELEQTRLGPGTADLWRIREKLRVLREKAQESGILPRGETEIMSQAAPPAEAPSSSVPSPVEPVRPLPPAAVGPGADYEPLFSPGGSSAPAALQEEPGVAAPHPCPVAEKSADFVVPALGLGDRLAALAEWACERLGTRDILLVDDFGDVLWGGPEQTPLVLSAMMAWQSAQHSSAPLTTSHSRSRIDKELSGGRSMTILSTRTRYGGVNLSAIREKPMADTEAQVVQEALARAVEG